MYKKTLFLLIVYCFNSCFACNHDRPSVEKIDEWVKIDEPKKDRILDGYDFGQGTNGEPILIERWK